MKFRLQTKLLIAVIGTISVIYILSIGYIGYNLHFSSEENAKKLADAFAEKFAAQTKADLDVDMDIARTLSQSFLEYEKFESGVRNEMYNAMMKTILVRNSKFTSVWSSWDLNAIDSGYTKDYGRIRFAYFRGSSGIALQNDTVDLKGDVIGGTYYNIKSSRKETVVDPYFFTYTDGNSFFKLLETTVVVPMLKGDKFVGLVGIDLGLERFQEMVNQIKPWENSFAFLVSNNGKFIAHPDNDLINKTFNEAYPAIDAKYKISSIIKNGEKYAYQDTINGGEYYLSIAPVYVGNSVTPWSIAIAVPLDIIMQEARKSLAITLLGGFFGIILLIIVIIFLSNYITKPINKISGILKQIASGSIESQHKMTVETSDEIGEIRYSVNVLIDSLLETVEFAQKIGQGDLKAKFRKVSETDILGKALINMQQSLVKAREEEGTRKLTEDRINWATVGHNRLSDILRLYSSDINELSYELISFMVRYLNTNQGALFIIRNEEGEEPYVEMTAHFAYDRRRIVSSRLILGEGLVGRCILEKETIFLTEIPDDYLKVTSGLGYEKPKYLVLIPLLFNKEVYGALEIASFSVLDDYKVKFLEEAGTSIASGISIVVLNTQRTKLFAETQIKSQEMAAQEEEMRQNFEEMISAQEEMELREREYKSLLNAVKAVTYVAEYDMTGRMTDINDITLELLNLSRSQIIGRYQGTFEAKKSEDNTEFADFWNRLRAGETLKKVQHVKLRGKDFYLSEVYTPVFDENGKPYKVLNIAVDITDSRVEMPNVTR